MDDDDLPEGDGPQPMPKVGKKFILGIDLEHAIFSGDLKDRDKEIANILRLAFTRIVTGQYTPDDPNGMVDSNGGNIVAIFEFKEG